MKVAVWIVAGGIRVVRTTGASRGQHSGLPRSCWTWVGLVVERSPKGEVNIERGLDFDGDVAGNTNSHVVPERVMGCG